MKNYWYSSILFFFVVTFQTTAQNIPAVPLRFSYFTVNDGMPSNRVTVISEDKEGFMWFGTDRGVVKYDGYQFKVYKNNVNDTNSINGNNIPSLFKDSKGRLWIGVEGLSQYNYEKDNFTSIELSTSRNVGDVYGLFEDDDGGLWLGTNKKGVYKYFPDNGKIEEFKPQNNNVSYLDYATVNVFTQTDSLIWMGTEDYGLIIYDKNSNKTIHQQYEFNESFPGIGFKIRSILSEPNGNVWIGTYDNGLYKFDKDKGSFFKIEIDPDNDGTNRVRSLYCDTQKHLWIGTRGGLYIYNRTNESFIHYAHENHAFSDLSQNSIFDIYGDSQGGLWLGTFSGGVNYANLFQKAFMAYPIKSDNNHFINSQNVYAVVKDLDGNVWLGTENGGLSFLNRETGEFTYFLHDPEANSILSNSVKEIIVDHMNNLWIATYNGGLSFFDTHTKVFTNYDNKNSEPLLPSDDIYSLLIDRKKEFLWIGTRKGLVKMNLITHELIPVEHKGNYISNAITKIIEDRYGNIWIVAQNRIYKWDAVLQKIEKEDNLVINNERIFTIHIDKHENIWLGGNAGLYCYNNDLEKLTKIDESIPYELESIYGILESSNDLWISTNTGLYYLQEVINDPFNFQTERYDNKDGLLNTMFLYNSYHKSKDGEMFFGGINGLNSFYPDQIKTNPVKPKAVLSSMQLYNSEVSIDKIYDDHVILDKRLNVIQDVQLKYFENIIAIEFAGLLYSQTSLLKYKYRLKGFDNDWNYTDANRRFASYTNLPSGEYVFEVDVASRDEIWSGQPASLNIKIGEAFWRTMWFKALILLVVVLLIIALYFNRVNTINKLNRFLEDTVKMRTKEIRDANMVLEVNKAQIEAQARDLEVANEKLKELVSTKDKFFSIIAHDLKNPFVGILGYCELLKVRANDLSREEIRAFTETLDASARNLYSLLDNLLTWARSQTDKLKYVPKALNIKDVVIKNKQLLKESIIQKELEFRIEGDYSSEVYVDENMVNTVMQNLLSNAIKFTPRGGLVTVFSLIRDDVQELAIKDTGVGMTEIEKDMLFKIDKSFSKEGTSGESGTGLGLILCKEFVERNKGSLTFESKEDKGTVFWLTLPLNKKKEIKTVPTGKNEKSGISRI